MASGQWPNFTKKLTMDFQGNILDKSQIILSSQIAQTRHSGTRSFRRFFTRKNNFSFPLLVHVPSVVDDFPAFSHCIHFIHTQRPWPAAPAGPDVVRDISDNAASGRGRADRQAASHRCKWVSGRFFSARFHGTPEGGILPAATKN